MQNRTQSHLKTYPSGSFIKNRTNMHEMENRMEIAVCAKQGWATSLVGGPYMGRRSPSRAGLNG